MADTDLPGGSVERAVPFAVAHVPAPPRPGSGGIAMLDTFCCREMRHLVRHALHTSASSLPPCSSSPSVAHMNQHICVSDGTYLSTEFIPLPTRELG